MSLNISVSRSHPEWRGTWQRVYIFVSPLISRCWITARVCCILSLCGASEFPRCWIKCCCIESRCLPLPPSKTHSHSSCYTGAPERVMSCQKNTRARQKERKQEEVEAKWKSSWEGFRAEDRWGSMLLLVTAESGMSLMWDEACNESLIHPSIFIVIFICLSSCLL